MKKIAHVFVVIPFFNEAETLLGTCRSLGFATDRPIGGATSLILVNNNSSDGSDHIATQLKERFKNQPIYVFSQHVQGIVSTRIAGNRYVREICSEMKIPEPLTLIIQADADTIYSPNYINAMRAEADHKGSNTLIEAETRYPETFNFENSDFLKACLKIDQNCEKYFSNSHNDLIVDDKAVGYRLEDYYKWGGHQIVFNHTGDELLAETTRLFMKAKTIGATRVKITSAFTFHSVRKIRSEPTLIFATAGYPREASWVREFYKKNGTSLFDPDSKNSIADLRSLHLLGLFTILPSHFLKASGLQTEKNPVVTLAIRYLPERRIHEIWDKKIHLLIEDVFELIEVKKEELLKLIHNR